MAVRSQSPEADRDPAGDLPTGGASRAVGGAAASVAGTGRPPGGSRPLDAGSRPLGGSGGARSLGGASRRLGPDPRPRYADESLPELLKRLSDEAQTLVRLEIALARAELTEKATLAGKGAGFLVAAAVVGLFAFGALTAFLIFLIATIVGDHLWLGALIVTLVYAAIAAFLALRGRRELQAVGSPAPEQTIETLKEDAQWAKTLK